MKVGYVVKRYPRFSETFIVNEILAHEAAGLDLEIFSLRPSNDPAFQDAISRVRAPVTFLRGGSGKADGLWSCLEEAGSEVPSFFTRLEHAQGENARDVAQAADLAIEASRRGITHLHAHFATSATSVARLASLFSGIPYTFTAHAKDLFHESVDAADLRRKLCDAKACVTVSDFNVRHLVDEFGTDAGRVVRIYNGMPLERYAYREPRSRSPHILAVGRLVEKKGFVDLLEACELLHRQGTRFSCSIIGAGELSEDLEAQIVERNLGSVVELAGPVPQREVIERMQAASVLAAPCLVGDDGNRDGLPTVLPEAMALGTPCVSTDVTGIPEIVQHEKTGLLIPERSPKLLADALQRLLEDAELRVRLAREARTLVEREYDVVHATRRQRELFG